MGMFDHITYEGIQYQTKDTPDQGISDYEIRGNELWYRNVKYEWVDNEESFLFGGHLKEISHQWEFCKDFDGAIRFYREDTANGGWKNDAWIEYKTLFMDGKMIKCERAIDEHTTSSN